MAEADRRAPVFWCESRADFAKQCEGLLPVRTAEDAVRLLATLSVSLRKAAAGGAGDAIAFGEDAESVALTFRPCVSSALEVLGLCNSEGKLAELFEAIVRWALAALPPDGGEEVQGQGAAAIFPREVSVWRPGAGPRQETYTAVQCRGLLANSLLMNVRDTCAPEKERRLAGGLEFRNVLRSTKPLAAHVIACLLQYFDASRALEGSPEDHREVVFERRVAEAEDLESFKSWALAQGADRLCDLADGACELHPRGMEAVPEADAFVNFANPTYGYGKFIASCTQEEILKACCPEMNIGLLHEGTMTDSEVVNVYNVRRFSSYTGYGDSFRFAGPWTGQPLVQTILTMDATTYDHFSEAMVLRDVQKAYLCFRGCKLVSTGKWGCGAFCGTPAHKFAQQIVAASLADCKIAFSTFGTPLLCDEVEALLRRHKPSGAELLRALLDFRPPLRAEESEGARLLVKHLTSTLSRPRGGGPSSAGGRPLRAAALLAGASAVALWLGWSCAPGLQQEL